MLVVEDKSANVDNHIPTSSRCCINATSGKVIFLENLDVAFMQHLELTSSYAGNISSNGRKLAHISTLVTVILSK